tara:strand:- start:1543 stop:2889 length:1347 start_codon:yes stop_codon:yes gene_type:complete
MQYQISILDHLKFTPTFEQNRALNEMSNFVKEGNTDDFLILSGSAGTGKTSITTALIGYLNSYAISYNIAAPTGRAARILGRKSKTLNSTIHSLIYDPIVNQKTGVVTFKLKKNIVKDYTVFIIDEASMISSKTIYDENSLFKANNSLLSDLITFVKEGNQKNKLIFLGDRNQLPPVNELESKALCKSFLINNYSLKGTSFNLTEVKRQDNDSIILRNANKIRAGIENNLKYVQMHNIEIQNLSNACNNYIQSYKKNIDNSVISIGATHKMNSMFNNIVRERIYGRHPNIIEKNDLLLISRTWSRNGVKLYSGDHVTVEEVEMNKMQIVADLKFVPVKLKSKNLKNEEIIVEDFLMLDSISKPKGLEAEQDKKLYHERFTENKIFRSSTNPSDDKYVGAIRANYGHSITCNKAQGGEWEKVFINSYYMPTLRYQYTAITRAKKSLILY